jgi:hypothetical protein
MKNISNYEQYKSDLDLLICRGELLMLSMQNETRPEKYNEIIIKIEKNKREVLNAKPSFVRDYQGWYSEALTLIRQLLPIRINDFTRLYEKPKSRKNIAADNYSIEDFLQGAEYSRFMTNVVIVGPNAAITQFAQQQAILCGVKARFESSLFDIRQLVQADVFDSELDAATELAKHKFARAAGALAGVVLERHLSQVCENHDIQINKKNPSLSDFYTALKEASIIDQPQWRYIQHLGDIRNVCDHSKQVEPSNEQVEDLIAGTTRIIKTIY